MPFTVQMDEEEFRIVGPEGQIGETVEYEEVATLVIGEDVYLCRVDDPDAPAQSVERVTQTALMPTAIEEVEFAGDEPEEEDDDPEPDGGEPIEIEEREVA